MDDLDFSILPSYMVFGDRKLEFFEKNGNVAGLTDFAILLGAYHKDVKKDGNFAGWWWTSGSSMDYVSVCSCYGVHESANPYKRYIATRISTNFGLYTMDRILYGEYPQMVANDDISNELELAYMNNNLILTGNSYTVCHTDPNYIFKPIKFVEFEYGNEKYIRYVTGSDFNGCSLSNNVKPCSNETYWIKVEPIEWIIDKKTGCAFSKKLMFAGIQFDYSNSYDGNFENTNMKKFIDQYFAKEIRQCYKMEHEKVTDSQSTKISMNPYNFSLDEIDEEEILEGFIESDIPVYIHGKSGEGKSARVLEIDNEATILYLANENPDSINGKSVYNEKNNEMIDIKPSWLVKLEEKCKDGKIHILFFDELTNAFPRVQSIVFNIILNKEVNGKWRLPDNVRIVAAGNEMEDSLSANELSEPLFGRFGHVYVKNTTEGWLKWASKHNIHPAIYSFVAYKNGSVLRSKYDGKKVNADPRKWEMASKLLYKTNNPVMLRSLVGEDITKEFIAFCKSRVITIGDVINNNYTNEEIEGLNIAEKYATVLGLTMVDNEHVRVIREFIKNISSELLKVFDSLWANTEERLEILAEIELEKKLVR